MVILVYVFLFIVGSCIGSFLGVLNTRGCEEKSIVFPGSHCTMCNHDLKWYDLIPVFSFIFNKGKCRYCHKKLDIYYLLCEVGLGLLFCLSFYLYGLNSNYYLLSSLVLFILVISIFLSDFKYYMILDSPLIFASVVLFVLRFTFFDITFALRGVAAGIGLFIIMLLIKKFGDFVFKRESLGGGDIKLCFILGIMLGFKLGICAIVLSSFLALPYALLATLLEQKKEVPFGPFIISACMIVFLFMPKFINLLNYLFNVS